MPLESVPNNYYTTNLVSKPAKKERFLSFVPLFSLLVPNGTLRFGKRKNISFQPLGSIFQVGLFLPEKFGCQTFGKGKRAPLLEDSSVVEKS